MVLTEPEPDYDLVVKNEVNVRYLKGVKIKKRKGFVIYEGFSAFSNIVNVYPQRVSLLEFKTTKKAHRAAELLDAVDSPNVLKRDINNYAPDESTIIVESFQHIHVEKWASDEVEGRTISRGDDFIWFFAGIAKGLKAIHYKGRRHGNLAKGLALGADGNIKLYNFAHTASDEHELEEGMKKDIADFEKMVSLADARHSSNVPFNPLVYFHDMCAKVQTKSGKDLRDWSYFVLTNPLFFDSIKRYHIFSKMWDWGSYDLEDFLRKMNMAVKEEVCNLEGWQDTLKRKAEFQALNSILSFGKDEEGKYSKGYGIILFIKNSYGHGQSLGDEGGCTQLHIEEMLNCALPDAIPAIFYKFVTIFTELKNGEKRDVVEFMKKDSHAFP